MGAPARSPFTNRTNSSCRRARGASSGRPRLPLGLASVSSLILLALLALPSATSAGAIGPPHLGLLPAPGPANGAPTLSLVNPTVVGTVGPTFWGANVRPYYGLGSAESAAFSASGLQFVRWPGGAVVDRLNVSANRIFNDNGSWYAPPTNVSAFASWCGSVSCHAVVGLPAEIDDAATAAYYVHFIEHQVGFIPEYWEIGNEPAVWTHFGSPWSHWTTAQSQNATPASYAQLVHDYVAAIRAVDPSARIVALGGLGTGGYGEPTWIQAIVHANGPNLSAVSIHVYPAGGSTLAIVTAADFYGTLTGSGSLAARIPADRAAILAGCRTCSIGIFASEVGSGTDGGPFDALMAGFTDVPYLAAEIVQAISLNVTQADLFSLEGSYDGSILNESGQSTSVATLYASFLAPLRSEVLTSNLTNPGRGVYVLPTRASASGSTAVLIANTNLTSGFTFQLRTPGVPANPGSLTSWGPSNGGPTTSSWAAAPPTSFRIGPESIALVVLNGGIVWNGVLPSPPTHSLSIALALPPTTIVGLLGFAAPTSLAFPCMAAAADRRRRDHRPDGEPDAGPFR